MSGRGAHLSVIASDTSGVQASSVQYRGNAATSWTQMTPSGGSTATNLNGNIDTTVLPDGTLTIAVLSTDKVAVCRQVGVVVELQLRRATGLRLRGRRRAHRDDQGRRNKDCASRIRLCGHD
jgi:hypothetical protein